MSLEKWWKLSLLRNKYLYINNIELIILDKKVKKEREFVCHMAFTINYDFFYNSNMIFLWHLMFNHGSCELIKLQCLSQTDRIKDLGHASVFLRCYKLDSWLIFI